MSEIAVNLKPCPFHPDVNAVDKLVDEDGFARARLTRYVCAAGCDTILGWHYRRTGAGLIAWGDGDCDHPEVLADLHRRQHDNVTCSLVGILVTLAMVFLALAMIDWEGFSTLRQAISLALPATLAAAATVTLALRLRRRPPQSGLGSGITGPGDIAR